MTKKNIQFAVFFLVLSLSRSVPASETKYFYFDGKKVEIAKVTDPRRFAIQYTGLSEAVATKRLEALAESGAFTGDHANIGMNQLIDFWTDRPKLTALTGAVRTLRLELNQVSETPVFQVARPDGYGQHLILLPFEDQLNTSAVKITFVRRSEFQPKEAGLSSTLVDSIYLNEVGDALRIDAEVNTIHVEQTENERDSDGDVYLVVLRGDRAFDVARDLIENHSSVVLKAAPLVRATRSFPGSQFFVDNWFCGDMLRL